MASLLLAGGGTAGHVNPLLATAAVLRDRGHRVAAVGTPDGLEADLVPRAGIELIEIEKVPFPRRPDGAALRFPGRLRRAIRDCEAAIEAHRADAVVGFGGYASPPVYWAARRRGIPIVVHEANARPGIANRLGARLTEHVAVTFPGTPLRHATVTGLPLRRELEELAEVFADADARAAAAATAREARGWAADAPVLLVFGGSLGAASVNAALAGAIADLVGRGIHVIHLTGRGKSEGALGARAALPAELAARYDVAEYSHDMAAAFSAADAVVCRSGAATVCEIGALGLPALYVPLAHGNGEQALNASAAVGAGAATLIPDAELEPARLAREAARIVLDGGAMREAARGIGIADGAARLAALIEGAL
ncbi:UDP-N-acetylglucosamine--N-acetylmuramyl-(pentapeptide) pyrophosphoryl-undecaprenol N-acetylglucosamine transferase [Demequina lignilytica]|uniref:UDP-N-acetylglucosamine--N-acetylmuramyl-(pentapeptide) pyrophosphoryl-undecaprenol N-acetylglucosamine transferase n=1 Tax=Demequina lignilytica TaxID=3051663 RepID=A0AB35MJN1_9MICO|nr:UDP-N-acetylglucosamine--N-acetylmuramyl-(pentapeptide) pyrophosphoryl-undecaprenol N-acetylglucosamine transferase [Demequina sp. SYSU T0a273]MDN4483962.1 UDP-N-acetylglucosamine--N-acetylmuramyl-(pentapeptide) pyrophosphoryl-undecaprenol N-acetylglucosamine transferase [Demequina sp. SYSU T0a273]